MTNGASHRKLALGAIDLARSAAFLFGGGTAWLCSVIEGPLRAAADGLGAGVPPSVIPRLVRQGANERVQAEVDRQRTPARAQTREVLGLEDEDTRRIRDPRPQMPEPPSPKRERKETT